ncbi:MAG: diguanylate cyclase [Myxococcota bacterium]|nr:diguanylate cyclase [Myxococcota bacterium]
MARRPPSPFVSAPELAGRKVLIVDDDRTIVSTIRDGLNALGLGLELFEANDGSAALSVLRAQRPDLLISDVEMPGMSGMDLCRIVKANQSVQGFGFVPVILVTSRREGKIEGLELGADDYLIKPFDMPELSARIKSMLRLKTLHDALLDKNRELDRANQELESRRQELLQLSRTDPLTGLHNRRYFEERLELEFERSRRYRVPISCLMLDLDHFKRLNDTHGHASGDEMLRQVAKVAKSSLRSVDLLARFGGEELIALLPETGLDEARIVAERIRAGIAGLRVEKRGSAEPQLLRCTASIGLATFPAPELETAEALLRFADDALYTAKSSGRDKVHAHADSRIAGPVRPG